MDYKYPMKLLSKYPKYFGILGRSNESVVMYFRVFWIGITQPFFQQKTKIFIHFTGFLFGIGIWAVENLRSIHHASVVRVLDGYLNGF